MMQPMKDRLTQILQAADAKQVNTDAYGVKTVVLPQGTFGNDVAPDHTVEVRYFTPDSYNRTKTEDFLERVNFLADVAIQEAGKDKQKIEKIQKIKEKYRQIIDKKFKLNIDPVNKKPKNFDQIFDEIRVFEGNDKVVGIQALFLHCQAELIAEVYGAPTKKRTKQFSKASQEFLAKQVRPILINVFTQPDGQQSINAHFPKQKETYPSTYQEDPTSGINPNSVMDVVAYRQSQDDEIEVKSLASRAVSFASETNAKTDIVRLLRESGRGPYRNGQSIYIDSTSLLTPEKGIVTAGAAVFLPRFESETAQAKVHHEALMKLNGQTIVIDGVNVVLDINHMNISVKDPKKFLEGSKTVTNQALLDEINNKGFKKYIEQQKRALNIDHEINKNTNFDSLLRDAIVQADHQKRYFYEVCRDFYNGTYKKSQYDAYLFVAKKIRSEELRREKEKQEVFVLWNCKSSRDRSDWESSYRKTLIDEERAREQGPVALAAFDFNTQLALNHEFSAGQEANGKGAPGARGNRVDDPTLTDKSKIDSRTSILSKMHEPKRKLMRKIAKAKKKDTAANSVIQGMLVLNGDENFSRLVNAFHDIQNPYLRVAMIAVLDRKRLGVPESLTADDLAAIVKKINTLFPTEDTIDIKQLKKKYIGFLEIVEPIPGLNDLRTPFITSLIAGSKLPDIKELKKKDQNELKQFLHYLDTTITFVEKISPKEARKYIKFKRQLERAISPGLYFGDLEAETPVKRVYVYVPSEKKFVEQKDIVTEANDFTDEQKASFAKQHTLYESETHLRYRPPEGETEPDGEVMWQVIQKAMRKFGVSDPRILQFEGALKEKAQAEIERRTGLAFFDKSKKESGFAIKVPEEEKARVLSRGPTVSSAA